MSCPTKKVREMRVRKAREILEELNKRIHDLEDQAVKVWYEHDSAYSIRSEVLQVQLTERYTTRRVLEGWLSRHE